VEDSIFTKIITGAIPSHKGYQAVWQTVKKIAKAQKKAFNPDRVGVQVVGLDVPHAHIHVIPFNSLDEYRNVPNMNAEPNHEELAVVAEKIKECL